MAVTLYRPLGYVGWAKQSAKGTGVTPTKFAILTKLSVMNEQTIKNFRPGNSRDLTYGLKETARIAGAFETPLFCDEGIHLLAALMGKDTKTGASDPYTHTLSFLDPREYWTFETGWYESNMINRFVDCKPTKAEIVYEAGKEWMLIVYVMGITADGSQSAATVTFNNAFATEGPLMYYDTVFTISGPTDHAVMELQLKKLKVTIDQGTMAESGPGQINPIDLFDGARQVSIEGEADYSGRNLHDLTYFGSNAGTAASSVIGTGSLRGLLTRAGSPEHSINIYAPNIDWESAKPQFDPDTKNPGIITFGATALKSGSTPPLSIVGKNEISTAYTS